MKIEMLATIHVKGRPFKGPKIRNAQRLIRRTGKGFILNKSAKKIKEKKARKGVI